MSLKLSREAWAGEAKSEVPITQGPREHLSERTEVGLGLCARAPHFPNSCHTHRSSEVRRSTHHILRARNTLCTQKSRIHEEGKGWGLGDSERVTPGCTFGYADGSELKATLAVGSKATPAPPFTT